jgi:hypothetical protein
MRLFKRKKKENRVCPNCKNPVPAGLAFCDSCGFRILPPPVCRKCQVPLAPDTNFCENCGTPAGTAPEAQPETPPGEHPVTEEERAPDIPDPEIPEPNPDALHEMQPETTSDEPPVIEKERPHGIPEPGSDAAPEVLWPVITPPPGTSLPRPKPDPFPDPGPVPARPARLPKRTLILATAGFICLIVSLAVLFWGAGCGNNLVLPGPSPAVTPAPATIMQGAALLTETPDSVEAAITGSPLVPGPVQVPPDSLRIWLQAERDPITHIVTVIYNGGKGERAVRDVTVRLTRSDGTVLQETFRPVTTGEGVEMQGTKYADRLEGIVTYNSGEAMAVIDRIFPYHERN